jgi:putative phosphoribosyl transferase
MTTAAAAAETLVQTGDVALAGDLAVPPGAIGLVIFAHGSGSGRHSPRNRAVAAALREGRLGTLLFDLLTEDEERVDLVTRHLRFDIPLLAGRVVESIDWTATQAALRDLPIGLFGASTGAAAALVAAASAPDVAAVVSRGGRPDLAGDALDHVRAPVLLIVGGADHTVLDLNRAALARLPGTKRLDIVPGATHLFEEPGALEAVIDHAGAWFDTHLRRPPP